MEFTNLGRCLSLALILMVFGAWSSEATSRTLQDASTYARYEQWIEHYGRTYSDINEKEKRFQIFKENVAIVESSNNDASKPYKLSVNQFADLTNEEFRATRNRFKGHECSEKATTFKYESATVPTSMDWRAKGASYMYTGCCWAFSAVAAMEGITQLTTGKLISLSEQELVDCDVNGQDQGCEGGLMDNAFDFINQNHGLSTEANYPYTGVDGTCNAQKEASHAASITGHEDVQRYILRATKNVYSKVAMPVISLSMILIPCFFCLLVCW